VKRAGWDGMMQIREEVAFTKGRIIVRGKLVTHGKAKRADYILYYKPTPVTLEISVRRPGWLETASKSGFKRISSPIWLGKSPGIKISGARFLGKFLGKLLSRCCVIFPNVTRALINIEEKWRGRRDSNSRPLP
jgi:hypothetical protein